MSCQCRGIAEHGGESVGNEALVGIAVELSFEVVQAVDAVEVFLGKPVAPLAVPFAFVPLLAAQELQAILIILSAVTVPVALAE